MILTGSSQHGCSTYSLPNDNIDTGQVGVGGAESVTVRDGHRQDLSNASGKRDPTTICSAKRRADVGCDVDAPMSPIRANGSKALHDFSGEWSYQPGA